MKGSQNLAGISDPVIDALIDKIIEADSRTSLTTACRVLDRCGVIFPRKILRSICSSVMSLIGARYPNALVWERE